jgi:hypothetical protein
MQFVQTLPNEIQKLGHAFPSFGDEPTPDRFRLPPKHFSAISKLTLHLQRGESALYEQEIQSNQHQKKSVYAYHHRGGKDRNEPSRKQIPHRHPAAEGEVVYAHDAAAHFVGGD